MTEPAREELARIVREHAGRLAAVLVRLTGDFAAAEDLVQDAVVAALRRWPADGVPDRPDAWLFTVARNRGLDLLRREGSLRAKLAQLQWPVRTEPDDRLRLIVTCCHPALPRAAQIALTLRVVCGLTTVQIARAFLVPEPTVAQRITRAKRKIADAGIPYRIPTGDDLTERLDEVRTVVYLVLNEGYLATADRTHSHRLVDDAAWLAALLHELVPDDPETAALLARAARHRTPGPYQLQAAIVACHAEARDWESTDWEQIVLLYDMLLHLAPSPVTRLHRAIALRYTEGPRAALAALDAVAGDLESYHLFHAARADLLRALGRRDDARAADERALGLTANPAEQALLHERLEWGAADGGRGSRRRDRMNEVTSG